MALRIRKNGKIVCAADTKSKKGDLYIDDGLHYYLFVEQKLIETKDEGKTWNWKWKP